MRLHLFVASVLEDMVPLALLLSLLPSLLRAAFVLEAPGCITRDVFDESSGVPVYRYTLSNGRVSAQVVEYGATLTSLKAPDRQGNVADVVLGYDTLQGYLSADNPYFGSTVGRVANRVGNAQFTLDGVTYNLFRNVGNHSLHGGRVNFAKKLWTSRMEERRVVMSLTSEDGDEGYPGQVTVTVTYSLTADDTLVIEYKAFSSKRTPINLTNHAYFNLAGHDAGPTALYNHTVFINSDKITETDAEFIPTGRFTPVEGTEFDLRSPKPLGEAIKRTAIDGFDNNFVLPQDRDGVVVAAVEEPVSGRRLEVLTSQPGLQFYTSNSISLIQGKGNSPYVRHAAFCLEAQNFPDAVNHPKEFPNSVYGPLDMYHQVIQFKLGVSSSGTDRHQ